MRFRNGIVVGGKRILRASARNQNPGRATLRHCTDMFSIFNNINYKSNQFLLKVHVNINIIRSENEPKDRCSIYGSCGAHGRHTSTIGLNGN